MCEFVSWIEKGGKVLFLTGKQVFETKKGENLRKWTGSVDDYTGHGAIRYYYGLEQDEGINKELTTFATTEGFPDVIIRAIKRGDMRGLAMEEELLSQQARAECKKVEQQAFAEYEKVEQQAWAEYEKVEQQTRAEYEKVRQQAFAEFVKVEQQAFAEYVKVEQQARAEFAKVEQQALAEYEKVRQQARAECKKVEQQAFWDIFLIPENRNPNWQ